MSPDEFADAHGRALLRSAAMLTGSRSDAEDLVQETFSRLLRNWEGVQGAQAPGAYARKALVNTHLNTRSSAAREVPRATLPDAADRSRRLEPGYADTDEMWALLAKLPPQQRTVLALRYYDDLGDDEIASILDITPGAVRTHASRGLAKLREHMTHRRALS